MPDWLEHLSELCLDIRQGGMTVETPAKSNTPVLRTVIQFDGDVLNTVSCDEGGRLPDTEILQPLLTAHLAALDQRLDRFAFWAKTAGFAGYGAIGATVTAEAFTGIEAWAAHSLARLAWQIGLFAAPAVLRFVAPPVIGAALKIAARGRVGEGRHRENTSEHGRLTALRSKRGRMAQVNPEI